MHLGRVVRVIERSFVHTCDFFHIADLTLAIFKRSCILMYHSVDGQKPEYLYEISIENFVRQMAYLKKRFDIVPLQGLYLEGETRKSKVALTFDDAYEDFYRNVFPLLKKYQLPATIFVPTAFIASETGLLDRGKPLYGKQHTSWEQLKEMHASGLVEIGSHTHSHLDFRDDLPAFERDVLQSIEQIEFHLGTRPRFFAYPYGVRTPDMDAVIQRLGFEFAVMSKHQWVKKQFIEGRTDIYARNQKMPYFKLTAAGLITTNTKEVYRKIKSRVIHRHPKLEQPT
jgi:peptidoglycan/xylan/chitin deacetylase (PgdA/CDA1 family)